MDNNRENSNLPRFLRRRGNVARLNAICCLLLTFVQGILQLHVQLDIN